jgi:hypothetical protein
MLYVNLYKNPYSLATFQCTASLPSDESKAVSMAKWPWKEVLLDLIHIKCILN